MKLTTKLTQITTAIVLATGITAVSMQTAQASPRNGGNVAAAIAGAVIHNAIDNSRRYRSRRSFGGGHAFRRTFGGGHNSYRWGRGGRHAFRRNFGGGRNSYRWGRGRRHGGFY